MWLPIETAPKDGTYILARVKGALPCVCAWQDTYGWLEVDEEFDWGTQSSWKPDEWHPIPGDDSWVDSVEFYNVCYVYREIRQSRESDMFVQLKDYIRSKL